MIVKENGVADLRRTALAAENPPGNWSHEDIQRVSHDEDEHRAKGNDKIITLHVCLFKRFREAFSLHKAEPLNIIFLRIIEFEVTGFGDFDQNDLEVVGEV